MSSLYDIETIVEQWIYDKLAVSSDLVAIIGNNSAWNLPQIYKGVAPETGVHYPYVIFQNQSAGVTNNLTLNGNIVWGEVVYMAKIVGLASDTDNLSKANKAMKDALHRQEGTALGGTVLSCIQETTFVLDPVLVDGEIYEDRGSLYRILVQDF